MNLDKLTIRKQLWVWPLPLALKLAFFK